MISFLSLFPLLLLSLNMIKEIFQFESFGLSDVGCVRDHNEDVWATFVEKNLFILADGMGGHLAGEVAAREAVTQLFTLFDTWHLSDETSEEEVVAFFKKAFGQVNTSVYKMGRSSNDLKGMGTTLLSLFFFKDLAVLAHVGDSRIYRKREENLEQLTEDHSLVSELVALGAMKNEESESFPYKHILTRAVGTHSTVEPTVNVVKVQTHDLFLLCSDGLTNYVSDQEILTVLQSNASFAHKGQILVDLANEHGGGDNITLILIKAHDLPG